MPGQAEPVLNRRPRLVPSAGAQIVFDQSSPERFTQGVEEAFAAGILPQSNYEKIKADEAKIFKVMDDRRKLEERAQADPRLLAILQGAGRGGAMTVGAVGGAKLLAAAGALTGPAAPIAVPVLGVAGAIGGGIAAGLGYDAIYNKLGEHFTEYDDVMKAAELFPMHKAGGEMGMVALAVPVSVAQGARGLRTAFQAGGLPQVARTAATAAGLGAGTGVVAYPIDAAVRGQEITPGGFVAAGSVGALTGGFFLNNRMAGAKDVAAVAAKMKAGTPLTAAETKLAQAAQPAISAAIARMDTAGGVRTGPLEVEVPMTSVAGLVPSVGRAAARVPYRVPVKLPAGAVARAKADVPQALPAPGKAAAADVPVPRTAPVNVLPSGTTVIPMPGPAASAAVAVPRAVSAAMAEPFNWALDTANERGINLEETETDNWNALLSEHLQIVRAAIDAGEPVSVKAFQVYDLSVPFYDLDPATGMATLNAQTLRDYEEYLGGQDADYRESMADAGAEELLAAVIDLGGLPAPKSGANRGVWSGELKALFEEAKGAGKGKGGDNQKGVFINKLFRRDGMDLDEMTMALRQKGFRVETEADLIELLGNRLRSGREIFGMATQSMEDVPLEMRGTRRAAGPRTMPDADAVKAQRYDALQRRIPSEGNVPAIKLKTGHLLTFEEPHVQFLEAKQIDPRDVESGGWVVDGDYRSSGERSDTLRWAERKLAAQRAQASRAVSSVPTQSTEDVPLEMRGTRRAAGPGPALASGEVNVVHGKFAWSCPSDADRRGWVTSAGGGTSSEILTVDYCRTSPENRSDAAHAWSALRNCRSALRPIRISKRHVGRSKRRGSDAEGAGSAELWHCFF
jgi:hypothetical protein